MINVYDQNKYKKSIRFRDAVVRFNGHAPLNFSITHCRGNANVSSLSFGNGLNIVYGCVCVFFPNLLQIKCWKNDIPEKDWERDIKFTKSKTFFLKFKSPLNFSWIDWKTASPTDKQTVDHDDFIRTERVAVSANSF